MTIKGFLQKLIENDVYFDECTKDKVFLPIGSLKGKCYLCPCVIVDGVEIELKTIVRRGKTLRVVNDDLQYILDTILNGDTWKLQAPKGKVKKVWQY